jgi:microcystin-dependent protein
LAVQSASGSSFERIPETTCNIYATNLRDVTLAIDTQYGDGDGVSTFALPSMPVEYRSGRLVKGAAICPSDRLGMSPGSILPFNTDAHS